jgi:O-antigen/teichoic acid export membrane protein
LINNNEKEKRDILPNDDEIKKPNIQASSQYISKAVIFTFLRTYGAIPISLLLSMLISRILGRDLWGIYIYSIVLIGGSQMVLAFIPPAIQKVILFKVPEMMLKNEQSKVKGLLRYSIQIKFMVAGIISIGYAIVALVLWWNNPTSVFPIILLLQSPHILIFEIGSLFTAFFNSIKKYGISTLTFFIEKIIVLIGYFLLFIINWDIIFKFYFVVILNLFVLCITSIIYYFNYRKMFHKYPVKKIKWQEIKKSIDFGINYSISLSVNTGYTQIYYGILNYYGIPSDISYNNICRNVSGQIITSISLPIGSVLADLEKTNQREKMLILFKQTIHFIQILVCFFIGFLFFFVKPYILILYEPEFLGVINPLRTYIFIIFFSAIIRNYQELFSITNLERKIMIINIINSLILSILAFIGMFFFGFEGIIAFKVIGSGIGSIICWIYGTKNIKELKMTFFFLFRQLFALILIISITNFFGSFLLSIITQSPLEIVLLQLGNIMGFEQAVIETQIQDIANSILYIAIFTVLYLLYLIFFKILTKQDISRIEKLNLPFPFKKFIFRFLKKITFSR